jgi:hypothetical protein
MKKLILGLAMASTVLLIGGCKKEDMRSEGKKPAVSANEKAIPNFDLTASYSCGGWVCNVIDFNPMPKYNMLVMTRVTKIAPLTYTLYERTYVGGGVEVYAPFDQFTCEDEETHYGSPSVNNNVKVLVIGTDADFAPPVATDNVTLIGGVLYPPAAHSSYETIITPSYKGQTCTGSDN